MSLFDKLKRKNASVISNDNATMLSNVERDVSQAVIIAIYSMKITSAPILKFIKNDNGIFEGIYQSHMNDPQVQKIRRAYGDDMYLNILGAHALGSGAYITLCQDKYNKPVESFSLQEAAGIKQAFQNTDPYELALKTLGYALDGNNKRCLDQVILAAMNTYKQAAGGEAYSKEYLKVFMKVLYNAGITVVLRG